MRKGNHPSSTNSMQLESETHKIPTGCGNMYMHCIIHKGGNVEYVANLGKSGTCARTLLSVICHLVSFMINNLPKEKVVEAMTKVVGHKCINNHETCGDMMLHVILDDVMNTQKGEKK